MSASSAPDSDDMHQPKYSIVVPTRNRSATLSSALLSLQAIQHSSFEIVLFDNASDRPISNVSLPSNVQIRICRSGRPLSMSASWETALHLARGEYITIVGDDDALLPWSLRIADQVFGTYPESRVLHYQRAIYQWPSYPERTFANLLTFSLDRLTSLRSSHAVIDDVANLRLSADQLPMLYNSFVHRDVVRSLLRMQHRVFHNLYPDILSGYLIAGIEMSIASTTIPLGIAGVSGASNGVAFYSPQAAQVRSSDFLGLHDAEGIVAHHAVPQMRLEPFHVIDSFLCARELLFPRLSTISVDAQSIVTSFARHVSTLSRQDFLCICKWLARYTGLAESTIRDMMSRYQPILSVKSTEKPLNGYNGHTITVRGADHGLYTVYDAALYIARLLGDPLDMQDLPSRHELVTQATVPYQELVEGLQKRVELLEHDYLAIQKATALRNTLRRVIQKLGNISRGTS